MYAICLRYAADTDEAKDIMQEGYIRVFDKLGQFGFKGSLEGWVRRIIVNTALEVIRKKVILSAETDIPSDYKDRNHESIFSGLATEEILLQIRQLTPQYRMVFNLYAIEGYSHKEIAVMLGIAEGTSKSNYCRAREILQEKLKVDHPEFKYASDERI